jgi:threonine dehydrogenase-like Zn-dependent dehydrogenase
MVAVGIAPGKTTAPVEITRLVRRELRIIRFVWRAHARRHAGDHPARGAGIFRPETMVTQRFSLDQADAGYQALAPRGDRRRAIVVP